jgi:hypothetical protein
MNPDPQPPADTDRPVAETDIIGPIATPRRLALCAIPTLLMLSTPLMPFATTPTLWFGVSAVMVWMAALVVMTVVVLQIIDRGITRQAAAAHRRRGDAR